MHMVEVITIMFNSKHGQHCVDSSAVNNSCKKPTSTNPSARILGENVVLQKKKKKKKKKKVRKVIVVLCNESFSTSHGWGLRAFSISHGRGVRAFPSVMVGG